MDSRWLHVIYIIKDLETDILRDLLVTGAREVDLKEGQFEDGSNGIWSTFCKRKGSNIRKVYLYEIIKY